MMNAFFPDMRVRATDTHTGTFRENTEGDIYIVGDSGTLYRSVESFATAAAAAGNAWDICEFWKAGRWWSCNEMLPPRSPR